jgi:hypothetical protein
LPGDQQPVKVAVRNRFDRLPVQEDLRQQQEYDADRYQEASEIGFFIHRRLRRSSVS